MKLWSVTVQTKVTIFTLSTLLYIMGLLIYSNHRALAANEDSLSRNVAHTVARLSDEVDASIPISRRAKQQVTEQVAFVDRPVVVEANPLILDTIHYFNDDIEAEDAAGLAEMIEETAERYDVDPLLVTALVSQESAFHTDAVSPVGAIGLGQLMPYTAEDLGVNPNDPAENLDGCVRYLAQNLDMWAHTDDPVALALASYNAGPGAVSNYGGIPPYEETQNYVYIITHRYAQLLDETATGA